LGHANAAGCHVVFGSDLLGSMQTAQCEEFDLRATVESRWDTLRAATVNAARLFQEAETLGVVSVGARADLIVVPTLSNRCVQLEALVRANGEGGSSELQMSDPVRSRCGYTAATPFVPTSHRPRQLRD
jgi:cytosine/adenosine deaminase-related metal-dependent hydrolase